MKKQRTSTFRVALLAASILLFGVCDRSTGWGPADSEEVDRIRDLLDRQVRAWNAGDLEGFMEGYWNSPDLSFFSGGTELVGWKATLDRYRRLYQKDTLDLGRLEFRHLRVQLLGSDGAFVTGQFLLAAPDTSDLTGRFTLILRRFADEWKIVHDHTSS